MYNLFKIALVVTLGQSVAFADTVCNTDIAKLVHTEGVTSVYKVETENEVLYCDSEKEITVNRFIIGTKKVMAGELIAEAGEFDFTSVKVSDTFVDPKELSALKSYIVSIMGTETGRMFLLALSLGQKTIDISNNSTVYNFSVVGLTASNFDKIPPKLQIDVVIEMLLYQYKMSDELPQLALTFHGVDDEGYGVDDFKKLLNSPAFDSKVRVIGPDVIVFGAADSFTDGGSLSINLNNPQNFE